MKKPGLVKAGIVASADTEDEVDAVKPDPTMWILQSVLTILAIGRTQAQLIVPILPEPPFLTLSAEGISRCQSSTSQLERLGILR